jgi:diaminopimelate decarboxylase
LQDILLRITPGIDAHTHEHITTGTVESKFGFPLAAGQAEEAVKQAITSDNLNLIGLHFHIGSQILEVEPYIAAMKAVLPFAAEMKQKYGFQLLEFSIGGGFAIQYVVNTPAPRIGYYADAIVTALLEEIRRLQLDPPRLIIEPGRSVAGQAGVAVYTVGAMKDIPGIRKYVFIDGGMADNIRPSFYDAEYEAIVANKATANNIENVTIAGKYCESSDILIRNIDLPTINDGDILAVPACGAYCLPMASNYNSALRPAIVMVNEGNAKLVRRRETYEDLIRCDV